MKKGIFTTVLRSATGDGTNNGLSSKESRLILVGPGLREQWEADEEKDYLVLTEFNFRGEISLRATPASLLNSGKHVMFGGNYCHCSKSNGNVTDQPIKIFDRVETREEYSSND